MSRLTLREWADVFASHHEDFYRKAPKGQIQPMFILERADGEIEFHAALWRDVTEKTLVAEAISLILRDPAYTRYALVTEVWTVRNPVGLSDDAMAAARAGMLHEHPDRVEAVSTFCVDRALPGQPVMVLQEIIRGRSGGVRLLKRIEHHGVGDITGRMATLFGEPTKQ